jgi:hypothetical protein
MHEGARPPPMPPREFIGKWQPGSPACSDEGREVGAGNYRYRRTPALEDAFLFIHR